MIPTKVEGRGSKVTELPKGTTVFVGLCKQGEMRFMCHSWDLKFYPRNIPTTIVDGFPNHSNMEYLLDNKEKEFFSYMKKMVFGTEE